MRNFARQGLVIGIAIAAAWALGCRDHASELANAASQAATRLEAIRASMPPPASAPATPAGDAEVADAPARAVYYRYVEPGGSIRFVTRIEDVPDDARASAKPIRIETSIAADRPTGHGGWAEVKPTRRPPAAAAEPAGSMNPPADAPTNPRADAPIDPPAGASMNQPAGASLNRQADAGQHEVVVYTTAWCPWCKKTLHWLDAKRVTYVNKDIEANPAWRDELVAKTGRASIPVVEIDGQRISGYDESAMERLL